MNNKKIIIISVLVVIVLAFYGGLKYGGSSNTPTNSRGNFSGQSSLRAGGRVGAGGGFTSGSILSKDSNSVTISLAAGGSMIVFMGTSTPIMKSVSGTVNDLVQGENILVSGTTNSDGSINASLIQIRPAQNQKN